MDSISMQFEVPAENKSSNMSLFNCVYYDTGEDTASWKKQLFKKHT